MGAAATVFMVLLLRKRIDNRARFANAGDVAQIRRRESSLAAQHMTGTALAFSPEDLFAMRAITGQRVVDGGAPHRMDICGDFPDFLFRELLGAHWRSGNAVLDGIEYLRIVTAKSRPLGGHDGRSDFSGAAVRSVAARAMLGVEALALVDSLKLALEGIHWPAALGNNRTNRAGQKEARDTKCPIHGFTPCKPKAKIFVPDAIAKNCWPFTLYVIGLAVMRSPVLKCHSGFPLFASSTVTCPNCSGVNTIPPAVDSKPGP